MPKRRQKVPRARDLYHFDYGGCRRPQAVSEQAEPYGVDVSEYPIC